MTKEQKTAYVVHPVSSKLKQSLRENGMKIIDARFAPEDAKIINPHTKREKAQDQPAPAPPAPVPAAPASPIPPAEPVGGIGTDSGDQFSDDQLRAAIETATGKAPHPNMKRESLVAYFNKLNAKAAAE